MSTDTSTMKETFLKRHKPIFGKNAISRNVEESFQTIPGYSDPEADDVQNLTSSSLSKVTSLVKFS